jgi:hypothetical protein
VKHKWFNSIFIFITLTNTITLACYSKEMSEEFSMITEKAERLFRYCFIIEMVLKISGLGFKDYFLDNFNKFDSILVIFSLVEESLSFLVTIKMDGGAFSALRALRLLRVFRLARAWKELQDLINKMEGSLKDISTFSILLLISMLIFVLLGSELYAYQI